MKKSIKKLEAKSIKNQQSIKGGDGKKGGGNYNGSTIGHETGHWLL